MTDTAWPTRTFLGLDIDCIDMEHARRLVCKWAGEDHFRFVVTPNVDHAIFIHDARASGDGDGVAASYASARLTLCDSRILARLARLSGIDLPVVPGSDLTAHLFRGGGIASGSRVLIVGADGSQVAALRAMRPDIHISHYMPPMGLRRDAAAREKVVHAVEEGQADFVLFAVGAPQSELIAARLVERGVARGVGLCIGASIEFITGAKTRAPQWVQRISMEWAFRLLSEPRRLWRRYLVEGPRIFALWWRWHRQRKGNRQPA